MNIKTSFHRHLLVILLSLLSFFVFIPIKQASAQTISYNAQVNLNFSPNNMPAGNVSVLTISITNPNAFNLVLSTVPAALSATLPTGVTFADPANATTTCSGATVSTNGTTLSLVGGTVPAKVGATYGSCTVSINVTSVVAKTHIMTIAANSLKSTDPTGTFDITNPTYSENNLLINSLQPPSVSKSFSSNTLWVGQNATLSVTIINNDLNYPLTAVSFTDNLPTNVKVSSSSVTSNGNCGSFSATGPGGSTLAVNDTSFTISNMTIAKATTCIVRVIVTSNTPGAYVNTIPANALSTKQAVTNSSAASAPINFQSASISKSFSPNKFQVGGQSTVTIILRNPTSSPYTGVSFSDTLPEGLTFDSASTSQCSGTVSVTPGTRLLSFSGGTIPSGTISVPGTCSITAVITGSVSGTFTNSIPANNLHTDTTGVTNVLPATSNVTVYGVGEGLTVSKSFSADAVALGDTTVLTINIGAPADRNITNLSITDALPSGLRVYSTPASSKSANCSGGTFSPQAGDTVLNYSGGSISKNTTCTLTVTIETTKEGTLYNYISPTNITNDENQNITTTISDSLIVSGLKVSKAFYPTTVGINGISTLTITLTNENSEYLESVAFTDTLPSGVLIAPDPNLHTTCGTGSVTASAGGSTIVMSGGVIPAQVGGVDGICTVNVDVIGMSTGEKTNTIPLGSTTAGVSAILHGYSPTVTVRNSAAATAKLYVQSLSINVVKSFSPGEVNRGSSSTLTVTLTNPNSAGLVGISFTDNLPQYSDTEGLFIATPSLASVGDCGGTLTATPGAKSFTFSNGYLAANSTCSLSLNITSNVENGLTNVIAAGDVTTSNGATNSLPATATLNNLVGASVQKQFLSNPILSGTGNSSTLSITITNESNVNLTGLGFTDIIDDGLTVVEPFTETQCNGGTVAYDSDTRQLTLTGGSLLDEESCTITVNVTAPSVGEYSNCIEKGALVNDQEATNDQACDILVVEQGLLPPVISKSFSTDPVIAGNTSPLIFTITNPNNIALTGVSFTDTFPSGLLVSTPPNPAQCNGTVTTTSGSITLSGGSITANGSCTVIVGTKSSTGGLYSNTSDAVTSTNGGTGNTASDTLTVIAPPQISKLFTPSTVTRGVPTTLTLAITNPVENTVPLTGVQFTDILPTGVEVADPANVSISSTCGSATFAPTTGNTTLTFSGGTLAVYSAATPTDHICVVSVDVIATNGGVYSNTTGAVSSTNGGTGNTANAILTVEGVGLSLDKSTTAVDFKTAGQTISYDYLLTNTGTATLYAPFSVTDDKIATVSCPASPTSLASGETISCSGDYIVQAADITSKYITNTASATAMDQETDGNPVDSNEDSVTIKLASWTLDKVTVTSSFLVAGDRIEYRYTVTNTGSVTLYSPFQISDNKFNSGAPFTCGSLSEVQPSGIVYCTKSGSDRYTVTAADVSNGYVTNTAFATAKDSAGSTITSNTDSVTVNKMIGPVISKAFSPSTIAVGGVSELTFTISNPNPSNSLTGVNFTDTFPTGLTKVSDPAGSQCGGTVTSTANSISLSNGSIIPSGSCTVSILVTGSEPKLYTNVSGTVGSTNGGSGNTATANLTILDAPVITKSFYPSSMIENATSTLSFSISNPSGNTQALTGVSFTDTLPTGLEIQDPMNLSSSGCGSPSIKNQSDTDLAPGDTEIKFSDGSIASGGTCTVTVDVTAPYGTYENTTSIITSTNGGSGVKSNTAILDVSKAVDLTISKNDSKLSVDRGEEVEYIVEVTNTGPSLATGAKVYDTFPSSLTNPTWTCIADTDASCTASGTGNIEDTVNLPAGKKVTYTITATIDNAATTSIVNTATVVPPEGLVEINEENNRAQDIDTLNLLTIVKSYTETDFDEAGQIIHYTYLVTNEGTSTLSPEFTVIDDKITVNCETLPSSLAPEEHFECTGEYTATQEDVDSGFITNKAYATAKDPDEDEVKSVETEKSISGNQGPLIGAAKRVIEIEKVSVGTWDVTFEVLIKNYGNVTLHNIAITDDMPATFWSPATSVVQELTSADLDVNESYNGSTITNMLASGNILEVGESNIVTVRVRVIPASSGPYDNTAVVYGTSPEDIVVQDDSQTGVNPDLNANHDPTDDDEPTNVNFGNELFDPPYGIKTLDSAGNPVLQWTMVWINDSNIVDLHARVSDPIPLNTEFLDGTNYSGYPVPSGEVAESTAYGISCTSSTGTTTELCYYQGPTPEHIRGQIIWQGIIGPDLGVTDPAKAINAITITFNVNVIDSYIVENIATIDSDRNGDGDTDDFNEGKVSTASFLWDITPSKLPETGFAPGIQTLLPDEKQEYSNLGDIWLEIPSLGVEAPIVGVPGDIEGWNVSWLGNKIGWLNGTAYPSLNGNSILTGHVYLPNGKPGPFVNLKNLKWGDKFIIHVSGLEYVYQVRQVKLVKPDDFSILNHEEKSWITLVTCQGYDEVTNSYNYRKVIKAILIEVK